MIVAKFGGGVLGGPVGVRSVCAEIRSLPTPLLVVVSAFANVTNLLEALADAAVSVSPGTTEQLDALIRIHTETARKVLGADAMAHWEADVEPLVKRLREVVKGLEIVRELSPRTLDLIVHFGERLASSIVVAALNDGPDPLDAGAVSALDVIITDTAHRYARPDLDLTRERVREHLLPALRARPVVVTEGYIARGSHGQVTTMGRESSSYSATLLAELLGASEARIYTNVPGVLTADPAFIPGARTITHLSYGAARTMAELGAKVLHPRTVTPVERGGIPLVITALGNRSTTIDALEGEDGYSVVFLPEATVITVDMATTDIDTQPFLREIAARVPIVWHHQFRRRLQVVTAARYERAALPLHLIERAARGNAAPASIVSLVRECELDGEDVASFQAALGDHVPYALQGGTDPHSVSAALPPDIALGIARTLHARLVETAVPAQT